MIADLTSAGGLTVVATNPVAAELHRLCDAHGGSITPEVVVESARLKGSPLHDHFEWDDSAAARAHRLWQASALIRSVKVRVTVQNRAEPVVVRMFMNVAPEGTTRGADKGIYVQLDSAMSRPDYHAQLLSQAKRDLAAWREKYSTLQELAEVFSAIEQHLDRA